MNGAAAVNRNREWPGGAAMDLANFRARNPLMREVAAFGVTMRLQGAGVLFSTLETLPADLRAAGGDRELLWDWPGGSDLD